MASSKLSEYQLRKIIEAYAHERSAAGTARAMKVSYVSIRTIYSLIRRRMIELNFYPSLRTYVDFMEDDDRQGKSVWHYSEFEESMRSRILAKRRGITEDTYEEHASELLFRETRPAFVSNGAFNGRHYTDIIELIRLSGPINRPVSPEAYERCWYYRAERALQDADAVLTRTLIDAVRGLDQLRKDP